MEPSTFDEAERFQVHQPPPRFADAHLQRERDAADD